MLLVGSKKIIMTHKIKYLDYEIDLIVRPANIDDISALVELNESWQKEHLNNNFSNGFLSARFSPKDFEIIVLNNEIVVSIIENVLIGYYLVNNYSERVLKIHNENVNYLKTKKKIPNDSKVGFGAQALIQKEFQGYGIREVMLSQLVLQLQTKYDVLYSTISKDNLKAFNAHTKDGWIVVEETFEKYFVIIYTKNQN